MVVGQRGVGAGGQVWGQGAAGVGGGGVQAVHVRGGGCVRGGATMSTTQRPPPPPPPGSA